MTDRLKGQLHALQSLCERIECDRIGIPSLGPEHLTMFFPFASNIRRIVDYLKFGIEPDFILRPEIQLEARRRIIWLSAYIVSRALTGNRQSEGTAPRVFDDDNLEDSAAQIRADKASQELVHRKLRNTFDHVLNEWADVGDMNHAFKSRFATAVVIEDIFLDALNISFAFNLEIPNVIENREQLPLTLAFSQVWMTCNKTRGYRKVVNFLRLVQSAIVPGTLVELKHAVRECIDAVGGTLRPREVQVEEAYRQLKECIRESGVDD